MNQRNPATISGLGRSGTIVVGIVLIAAGVLLLLSEYGFVRNFRISWPVILIIVGVAMLVAYHTSKPKWSYLEGGFVLILLGLVFYWIHDIVGPAEGYRTWWPLIVIAAGLGQLLAELYGPIQRRQIVPSLVTIAIGGLLLALALNEWRTWDIDVIAFAGGSILIFIGLIVLAQGFAGKGGR
jgi:hypothetical protein